MINCKCKFKVGMHVKDCLLGELGIVSQVIEGFPFVVYFSDGSNWQFSKDDIQELVKAELEIKESE